MKKFKILLPFLLIALCAFYGFCYYYGFTITSDNAFFVRAAEQIFHGNPLLKGWVACFPTALTTDFLWVAILRTFLSRQMASYWMGPIVYTLIVLFCWLILKDRISKSSWIIPVGVLGIITLVPAALRYAMLSVGVHSISVLYILILIKLLDILDKNDISIKWAIIYTLFLAFASPNDEWPVYFFAAPLLLVLFIEMLISFSKKHGILFVLTLIGIVGEKLIRHLVIAMGGIKTVPFDAAFISLKDFPEYLNTTLITILQIFNADISNQELFSVKTVLAAGGIFLLIEIIIAYVHTFKYWKSEDLIVKTMIAGSIFCLGSYIFARVYKDPYTIVDFYISPFFFLSMLLLGRWKPQITHNKLKMELVLLCPMLIMMAGNIPTNIYRKPISDPNYREISNYLEEQGVTRVYADFWNTHSLWYYSDGKIQTASIRADHNQIEPYIWLTNMTWYEPAYFTNCIVISPNAYGLTKEYVENYFGQPETYHVIGDTEIFIYPESISSKIAR